MQVALVSRSAPYGLREFDPAFDLLDREAEQRFGPLAVLSLYPSLEPLQADPRYPALLERTGQAEESSGMQLRRYHRVV